MSIRIVKLGTERMPNEGLRMGTVRRPPRGVRKHEYARRDFYDVWLPNLAPSEPLLKSTRGNLAQDDERGWKRFVRAYRAELKTSDKRALLATLAAFSHRTDFSVGCYCADEARCHRSVLRELLIECGAKVEPR